jgi:hypothetical protein
MRRRAIWQCPHPAKFDFWSNQIQPLRVAFIYVAKASVTMDICNYLQQQRLGVRNNQFIKNHQVYRFTSEKCNFGLPWSVVSSQKIILTTLCCMPQNNEWNNLKLLACNRWRFENRIDVAPCTRFLGDCIPDAGLMADGMPSSIKLTTTCQPANGWVKMHISITFDVMHSNDNTTVHTFAILICWRGGRTTKIIEQHKTIYQWITRHSARYQLRIVVYRNAFYCIDIFSSCGIIQTSIMNVKYEWYDRRRKLIV